MQLVCLFIPLLTSFYISLFGRFIKETGGFQSARFGILLSWISNFFWFGNFKFISFGIWFSIGTFNFYWTFNFSSLSWIMYFVVTTVAFVVYNFYLFKTLILLKKWEY
jgi:NADH:ubiquinone oxidoreductase subunit 5 (subunit L)/multisubunit Na+/H+ antiporter MnhA subunit